VATTESAATTTMSSGQGIRRNRHRADQQSRSRHSTKITLHEYLQWFDQFTLIVHEHISGSAAGTIKLAFRKLNSILSEQVERAGSDVGAPQPRKAKVRDDPDRSPAIHQRLGMQPASAAPIGTSPAKTMRGLLLMWPAADADGRQ
jgi:hypothetical protein